MELTKIKVKTNRQVHPDFKINESVLDDIFVNFETKGTPFGDQERNTLKTFDLQGYIVNVKSFRIPNFINQVAYRFFRKSKAQRSFIYANKLKALNIGTPQPVAFYEEMSTFLFKKSYYVSQQLDCDYTYRDLTKDFNIPDYETILRAFTRFTFNLHENNILFLDHSPGNTLIKKVGEDYQFYLVDLNRMQFKDLSLDVRIKNFARLTIHKSMVEIMSDEYAKCSGADYDKIFNLMWKETEAFQEKFYRKKRLKKKLKFWKR